MRDDDFIVFGGSANPRLTKQICGHLDVEPGMGEVIKFSDGNLFVRIGQNVRGRHVYLVQSTVFPTNDNFMELLFWIDAFRRASAASVTAIDPVLQLRQGRQEGRAAGLDPGPGVHPVDRGGRRRPGRDAGSARAADPGLLQHPGRRSLRAAGARRRRPRPGSDRSGRRVAGRRLREEGPAVRQTPVARRWRSPTRNASTTARPRGSST